MEKHHSEGASNNPSFTTRRSAFSFTRHQAESRHEKTNQQIPVILMIPQRRCSSLHKSLQDYPPLTQVQNIKRQMKSWDICMGVSCVRVPGSTRGHHKSFTFATLRCHRCHESTRREGLLAFYKLPCRFRLNILQL